jgi:hypothetical protein
MGKFRLRRNRAASGSLRSSPSGTGHASHYTSSLTTFGLLLPPSWRYIYSTFACESQNSKGMFLDTSCLVCLVGRKTGYCIPVCQTPCWEKITSPSSPICRPLSSRERAKCTRVTPARKQPPGGFVRLRRGFVLPIVRLRRDVVWPGYAWAVAVLETRVRFSALAAPPQAFTSSLSCLLPPVSTPP